MSSDWPAGVGRIILPEIDSTNAEAARIAPSQPGAAWILALRQTKGRGRRGRVWTDPQGNFAATFLCRPEAAPDKVAQYSFVVALALHNALVQVTGRPETFSLKWPNDVLLNGGKLAGILLEGVGRADTVGHLSIGIGVNLLQAPEPQDDALRPVALLPETGIRITPEEFLDILAPAFARWQAQFVAYGFGPIRTAWMARAARIGQTIRARTVNATHDGVFEGIDDSGALVLRTPTGHMTIPAAEVFF